MNQLFNVFRPFLNSFKLEPHFLLVELTIDREPHFISKVYIRNDK